MSQEKTPSDEAIDFVTEQVEKGNLNVASIAELYAEEQTEDLSNTIKDLERENDSLREDVRMAEDEKDDAEADRDEVEDQLSEFEEVSAKTLEDELKFSIIKRLFKNLNLQQLEAVEEGAKNAVGLSGKIYQDY